MIKGWVLGDKKAIASLEEFKQEVRGNLTERVQRLAFRLLGLVKAKLSDDVLHVRTGRLRRSINQRVEAEGSLVTGIVGTNVEYARFQEKGFTGTQNVKEHLRTIKQAFGRPIAEKQITVRAHTRNVNYPAHSFLGSALAEMRPQIELELSRVVK